MRKFVRAKSFAHNTRPCTKNGLSTTLKLFPVLPHSFSFIWRELFLSLKKIVIIQESESLLFYDVTRNAMNRFCHLETILTNLHKMIMLVRGERDFPHGGFVSLVVPILTPEAQSPLYAPLGFFFGVFVKLVLLGY